jgi:hypothetical protein
MHHACLIVDSVRFREPSPYGIAFGDSILPVPNGQDSTDPFDFAQGSACCLGYGQDDGKDRREMEFRGEWGRSQMEFGNEGAKGTAARRAAATFV